MGTLNHRPTEFHEIRPLHEIATAWPKKLVPPSVAIMKSKRRGHRASNAGQREQRCSFMSLAAEKRGKFSDQGPENRE